MAVEPSLTRNTLLLTLSGGIEFGLQFAIPMIFVRQLDPATFGQYRLMWLMAATALAIGPAFMPQSLYYFLPRSSPAEQRVYIGNVLAWLSAAGCVVALVASGLNPWLPDKVLHLFSASHGLSSLFLLGWVVASIMTALPTAEGRVRWQVGADLTVAVLRTLLLAAAAIFTHDIAWVVAAMLGEALLRIGMCVGYLLTRPGGAPALPRFAALATQLRYAFPFALGNALFLLRGQSDQWVAAALLPTALFGMFSIGAVVLPFITLVRQPVNNVMMPRLNKAYAEGDLAAIRRLLRTSSTALTLALVPLAGLLACVAPQLVEIVYTGHYAGAVPVMRIYLLGMMMQAMATGYLLPALEHGRFAAANNACCLAVSIAASIAGASRWGLSGAACGSVFAFAVSELWSLTVVARTLQAPARALLPWRTLIPSALGTALAMGAVMLVQGSLAGGALMLLLSKSLVFLVVFAPVFFAAGGRAQLQLLLGARLGSRHLA
jgi:O-antigen/teichoic acid export membrane protein